MQLPPSAALDIPKLNRVFSDTTNAYKFYWFLAILESVRDGQADRISMDDLALHMVANVWYPLDYYKLSFGNEKMDGFKKIAGFISERMTVNHAEKAPGLFDQIKHNLSGADLDILQRNVRNLLRYVPYRFVRPFFEGELRGVADRDVHGRIVAQSAALFDTEPQRVVYAFEGDAIRLNPVWADYFRTHYAILQGFVLWHLTRFLQKHNPNVPGLSEKLFKNNNERNLRTANQFWTPFLAENPGWRCIYSDAPIDPERFSMDHFLPWSFVVHNHLWNLVPVSQSVNSSKSNWLPDWDQYFPRFAERQYQIVRYHLQKGQRKLLEDYSAILLHDDSAADFHTFRERLHNQLWPQFQIARNMGFGYPYVFG